MVKLKSKVNHHTRDTVIIKKALYKILLLNMNIFKKIDFNFIFYILERKTIARLEYYDLNKKKGREVCLEP